MYAYQWWADTTTGLLKIRNAANSAWVTIGTLASANLGLLPLAGGTMTGVLAVTAGTAALPGIAVSGDTNTGIYSPGADQIGIATGGTSRIVVDASGNVNIDSNTFYVDAANNRVGIGTTSPAALLQVLGETLSTTFVANGAYIAGPPQALQVMDQGKLRLSTGTQAQFGADIYTVRNSAFEDNISLVFAVPSIGSSSPTERLRIDFAGTTTLTSAASTAPFIAKISTTEVARIDSSGRLLVGTSSDSGGALLQVNGDRIRIGTAKTPASATATGTAGEICWDANYIYVCTATNTWKRTAIATW
jgi:hypothetical protein